jgi:hypothetical protein
MDKIVRYETSLERSLIRTLHEFQRLHCYRAGRCGPPNVLDISVSSLLKDYGRQ